MPHPDDYRITIERLREWHACADGRTWFRRRFPDGASYAECIAALLDDQLRSDASWLTARVIDAWGTDGDFIAAAVADEIRITTERAGDPVGGSDSRLAASGDVSSLAASGDASSLAASGWASRLAASGDVSSLAASGSDSRLAASGNASRLAASGNASRLAASGSDSRLAASGWASRLAASGSDSVIVSARPVDSVTLGARGLAMVAWHDGTRWQAAIAQEGIGGIEAGVAYRLDGRGAFVRVDGAA